MKNQA